MGFFVLSLLGNLNLLYSIPWWIYIISLILIPLLMIPIQEGVRWHDKNEWLRFQKRSKLEFNTKLYFLFSFSLSNDVYNRGMHSPI